MARTQITGRLIEDSSVGRPDINTTISGQALITKLIVGSGLSSSQTGVDPGTGDVTISLNTSGLVTSFNSRAGAVSLSGADVTDALGFTPISGESDTLDSVTARGAATTNSIDTGGYSVIGSPGWFGDINIDRSNIGQGPLVIQIQGGIIVNVIDNP